MQRNTPPQLAQQVQHVSERIIGLDLFRITLAFIIFLFHSRIHMKCDYGLLNVFVEKSNILAMTGFFMLSGYALIISNGRKDFGLKDSAIIFYKKRFISVWPLYFVAGYLGVGMFILMRQQTVIDNIILLPIELLGIQAFFDTLFPYSHNAGSWFISCLFACYFIFPWLNILFSHIKRIWLVYLLVLLVVLLAYFPYIVEHFHTSSIYANPFFRMLEFTVGMVIGLINTSKYDQGMLIKCLRSPISLSFSVLFLVLGISYCGKYNIYMYWMPIVFLSIILFALGYIKFPISWNNKCILYLSAISYAFYLGQKFVWFPTKYLLRVFNYEIGNIPLIFIMLVACLLSAIMLHELVEKKAAAFLKERILNNNI